MVRGSLQEFALVASLEGYLLHHINELVQGLLALCLGRLYHHGLVEKQGEVDGGCMIAIVEQALCHIQSGDVRRVVVVATVFLAQAVEDKLVLAQHIDGQLVVFLQVLLDVVGVQHRQLACHGDVLLAQRKQVGIGTDDNAEVAQEGRNATQRLGVVYQGEVAVLLTLYLRIGQVFLQTLSYANRTAARATTAMRCGECLVQIDVHNIETHVAGAAYAQHGVQVGTVVVHQTTALVHQSCYLGNLCFEDTQGVGVGHHHAGNVIAQQRFQILHVHGSVRRALHLHYLQTAHGGGCRVGAMC